jgi:hypothetical protein
LEPGNYPVNVNWAKAGRPPLEKKWM